MKRTQPAAQMVSRLFYSYEVVPVMRPIKWNIEKGLTGEGKDKKSHYLMKILFWKMKGMFKRYNYVDYITVLGNFMA